MDDATGPNIAETGAAGSVARRIESQRRRVAQNPDVPGPRHRLAEMLKAEGLLAEAEAILRETVALFPNNRRARTELQALAVQNIPDKPAPAPAAASRALSAAIPVAANPPAAPVTAKSAAEPPNGLQARAALPGAGQPVIANQAVPGLSAHFPTFSRATRTPLFTALPQPPPQGAQPPPPETEPRPAQNARQAGPASEPRPIIPLDTPATETVTEGWDPPGREWLVIGALALLFGGLWAREAWFPPKLDSSPVKVAAGQPSLRLSEPHAAPNPQPAEGQSSQPAGDAPPANQIPAPDQEPAQAQAPTEPAAASTKIGQDAALPRQATTAEPVQQPAGSAPVASPGSSPAPAVSGQPGTSGVPSTGNDQAATNPPGSTVPQAGENRQTPAAQPEQEQAGTSAQDSLPPLPDAIYVPPHVAPGVQAGTPALESGTMPASVFILFDPKNPAASGQAASLAQRIRDNHLAGTVSVAAALGTIHAGMTYFHTEDRSMALALGSKLGHMGQVRFVPPPQQDALPPGTIAIGVK